MRRLGGMVLVTAAKLFDTTGMRCLWRMRRADFALMGITFLGVIVTGVEVLERLIDDLSASGAALSFARVRTPVMEMMRRRGSRTGSGPTASTSPSTRPCAPCEVPG